MVTTYWCLRCSYSTTSQDEMNSHINNVHGGYGMDMYSTQQPGNGSGSAGGIAGALNPYSGLTFRGELAQANSSYIPDSKFIGGRGRSIYGRLPVIFVLFLFSLAIIFYLGSPGKNGSPPAIKNITPIFVGDLLMFGALFILEGWLEFSLEQTIRDIPTIKIDAAAAGLNEINAAFIQEKGDTITSLVSKQSCVFYRTALEKYVHRGKNSYWETIGSSVNGIPSLLTDGTGYLAIDLSAADINLNSLYYYPLNSKNQAVRSGMPDGVALQNAFYGGVTAEKLDGLKLEFNRNGVVDFSLFGGDEMRVIETVVPVAVPYFAMGRIGEVVGRVGSMPVKLMSRDPQTKILTVRSQSKSSIESTDKRLSFISFGIGVLFIIGALAYFGF